MLVFVRPVGNLPTFEGALDTLRAWIDGQRIFPRHRVARAVRAACGRVAEAPAPEFYGVHIARMRGRRLAE